MKELRRWAADRLVTDNPYRQWVRVTMEKDIQARLRRYPIDELDVLEVSGDVRSQMRCRSYRSLSYPEIDLNERFSRGEEYDLVWCEQVLEHVERPLVALDNLIRLTRPGGRLILSTPFLIRLHMLPRDFWRFTPATVGSLLADVGFEEVEVRSWGNALAVLLNLFGWITYRPMLPLTNNPRFPVTIWASARRPVATRSDD